MTTEPEGCIPTDTLEIFKEHGSFLEKFERPQVLNEKMNSNSRNGQSECF